MPGESIRWGILSTARIVERSFLPGLEGAGSGEAYVVGSRDRARAEAFAARNGIQHARTDYQSVLDDDRVDAIYIPLPNTLHAEWTIKAIEAGKAVLCEKPLTADRTQAEQVLGAARARAGLLWEAFVFLFREQSARIRAVLDAGTIGETREVQSSLHFPIAPGDDIRYNPKLGGGSLLDGGCYCVQLGRFVFEADPHGGMARATWTAEGVDQEMAGVLTFSSDRRLVFSCGFATGPDSPSRILGTDGEMFISHAFHPSERDFVQVRNAAGEMVEEFRSDGEPSFASAIDHIHRVLWGEEPARNLATEDGMGNAVALDLLGRSARSGRFETV